MDCLQFQTQVKGELDTLKREKELSSRTERVTATRSFRNEKSYSQNEIINQDYSQSYLNQSNISDHQQNSYRDMERSGSDYDIGLKQSIYDKIRSIKKRKEQIQKTFRQPEQRSKTTERVDCYSRKRTLDHLDR